MPRPSAKSSSKKSGAKSAGASRKKTAQRLQRLLASAGFGSRRQCETMIEEGRVEVDGEVVTQLGTTADPSVNKIRVDGVPLKAQKLVYYAVNKPVGIVTTNSDPQGRPRVVDLVPKSERVFAVGRLDRSSEGLILLTNDGDLAQRLTHPKFGVRKVYRVTVAGRVESETMRQMRQGIYIAEGHVKVEGAKILKARPKATEMEIVLREGKNREIRRILARLGHKVQQLRRIAVGPLRLGDMPAGAYRIVSREEVHKLQAATEPGAEGERAARATKKRATSKSKSGGSKKRGVKGRGSAAAPPPRKRGAKKKAAPRATMSLSTAPRLGAVIGGDPAPDEHRPAAKKKAKKGAKKKRTSSRGSGRTPSGRRKSSAGKGAAPARGGKNRTTKKRSVKKGAAKKRKR